MPWPSGSAEEQLEVLPEASVDPVVLPEEGELRAPRAPTQVADLGRFHLTDHGEPGHGQLRAAIHEVPPIPTSHQRMVDAASQRELAHPGGPPAEQGDDDRDRRRLRVESWGRAKANLGSDRVVADHRRNVARRRSPADSRFAKRRCSPSRRRSTTAGSQCRQPNRTGTSHELASRCPGRCPTWPSRPDTVKGATAPDTSPGLIPSRVRTIRCG